MGSISESLERGVDLFREILAEDPLLEREFAGSVSEFAAAAPQGREEQRLASRRHLEWFVLERPSASLGGVPVEALQEAWLARADPGQRALGAAFLESLAGAFEVTQAVTGEGVWVRDLFSLGEFAVDEPEAAAELQPRDLVVGRLFPIANGVHRFSSSSACFRDARLLEAVREDLERMRQARRGVLRVQQIELERLFFNPESSPPVQAHAPAEMRAHARDLLLSGGLDPARAEQIIGDLQSAKERGDGRAVTELLNELAFETELDLDAARQALVDLWTDLDAERDPAADAVVAGRDVRAALEAFDRGRAAGQDLDQLFRSLETELGFAPGAELEDEGDPARSGELPGVIAGLVEEFLWDVGRERETALAERWQGLRRLGLYARAIAEFEDLGPRELVDFAGRWLLDEGGLESPAQAAEILEALGEFCRWAEERHGHPLWTGVAPVHEALSASVPRLLELRALLPDARAAGTSARRVLRIEEGGAWLELPGSGERRLALPRAQLERLRPGDFVRLSGPDGSELASAYPAEIEGLLRQE